MSIEAILKANRQGNATQFTRRMAGLDKGNPEINMRNGKPYRSKALKKLARENSYLGAQMQYKSDTAKLWHK